MIRIFKRHKSIGGNPKFKSENMKVRDAEGNFNKAFLDFFNISKEKDTISPTFIREIDSKDKTVQGYPNSYYVEVGSTTGNFLRFYRSFFAILTAENTYFGMFDDLFRGNFGDADCDVAIHVTSSDEQKVMWMLSRKIAGLEADLINETRSIKVKELKDQLADLHSQEERLRKNIEKLYSVSIQSTISSDNLDGLKKFANRMIKRMANQGTFLRSADTKQLHSLLAITPLGDAKKDLKYTYKNMETSNIADMFPFKDGTISHTSGYLIGEDFYGKPVYYDDRHHSIQNYNSVTFGVAGSGKSMKTKILHSRKLITCTMTTIIDYEKENKDWILKLGFPYIEFTASNTKYAMNVFPIPRVVFTKTGEKYCDIDDAVNTVSAIVFKMIRLVTEKPVTGNKKILIKETIQKCYFDCGITYDAESIYKDYNIDENGSFTIERQYKPMPQLINLYERITNIPELVDEVTVIKSFTKVGNIKSQSVFDCQSNFNVKDSLLVGISVAELDEIMRPIGLYVSTTNSWSTYERMPKSIKKDIIVDEAQNMMVDDDEANWLEQRFRISRKRNIGVHAVTQGFEVFLRKPQGMGILKNASTKFLFRQDPLDIDAVEGKFNLPEGAKMKLLSFDKGECIFIVGNEMTLLKTRPMPTEYAMFSTDPTEAYEG